MKITTLFEGHNTAVKPVHMFSKQFRRHHHKFCKWCELSAGIFVGIETHMFALTIVCVLWVIIDALEIYSGLVE